MAGFQLRQAFWIGLLLAQQLPKGLLRLGVVAGPPASNPIDHALSGGSNAIADLEPTRHDNVAPAQFLATHGHCDESPKAEMKIEQDLTAENRLSPSGHKLSASHSRGIRNDASVAPLNASSQKNVETRLDTEAEGVSVPHSAESDDSTPESSPTGVDMAHEAQSEAVGGRTETSRPEPIHSFESGHVGSSTANPNTEDRALTHRQEPGHAAMTEETPLAAGNAGRNTHDAGLPTSDNLHNSEEVHDLPSSHQPSQEIRRQASVPRPNRYSASHHRPGPQQASLRFQLHRFDFLEPVIVYRHRVSYAYLPGSHQTAFHPTLPPIPEQSYIHAQRMPATHHAGLGGSLENTLRVNGRRFPRKSSGSNSFPDYQSTRSIPLRLWKPKKNRRMKYAVQWKAKNGAGRAANLPAEEGVESSSLSNLPASTASTSSGSEHYRAPESPKQSDSLPIDSPTHKHVDSKTPGTFPNEPSEVLPPSPQAVAEMETSGEANGASEAKSPPLEGREQVIDSSKQTINAPAKDPRATLSELKNELGSAMPANSVKSAFSAKPVKVSVPARPGSSRDAATTSSKGGDLEEPRRGQQVPSNKQLALPLQPDMPKPSYPHSSDALPPDYKPQATEVNFPKNLKNNGLKARHRSKKIGPSQAVASLPRHNRFAALEDSDGTGVQKQDSRVVERLLQNEIPKSDGETVQHELDSKTSSDESSGSESDASTSSKMNDDSRINLHPHIASLGQKISRLQTSFPTLRLSFSSSTFVQNVLHYLPSFSARKSLIDFISNYKSKFVKMVARERGHEDHPVPVESQEDLSQAKWEEENKRAKGKAPLRTSRLSHGPHPSRSNPPPPKPAKTRPQAEAPEGSGNLNESQRSDSGMSTEKAVPRLSSRKQKAARLLPLESKEFMPDYLQEYMKQNPGAKARELELVKVAGTLLRAEVVGTYTAVFCDPNHSSFQVIEDCLLKAIAGEQMVKQIRWLTDRIGDIEGRRRWKALVRRYNQARILYFWSALRKETKDIYVLTSAKILKLGEAWPTFLDATLDDHNFAQKVILHPLVAEKMHQILGREELTYRLECIRLMSGRRYPHNWLSTDDMITAYQQGLNTNQIILVGDYLQFGRDYLSLVGQAGVAPEGATYAYLNALWKASFPDPWGTSAEKTWLLSDPHRAQLYVERLNRLKHRWKYFAIRPEQLINTSPEIAKEIKRKKLESKVWWNLADIIEWQEYHMPPQTMCFIGFELGIPKERNVRIDTERLKKILAKKKLSKQMKEIIEAWFKDHALSPYDNLPKRLPSEEMDSWADLKTFLAVCWKQKTLKPQHQPLFLNLHN